MIVCDTHALIFDTLAPERLGPDAAKSIEESHRAGELTCADISLWEIAMLMEKGRLQVDASMEDFITAMITARDITGLPLTPAMATGNKPWPPPIGCRKETRPVVRSRARPSLAGQP